MSTHRHHRSSSYAPPPISWASSEGSNVPAWLAPPSQNPIPRPSSAQSWNTAAQPAVPWGGSPSPIYAPPYSPFIVNAQPQSAIPPPSPNSLYVPAAYDIRRPNSTGPYAAPGQYPYQVPGYARPDVYDENNLARRPRDWREDYEPRYGVKSILNFVSKHKSDVEEYTDPVRRTLDTMLAYSSHTPSILYDLRCNPFQPGALTFPQLQRPHNDLDLAQLATKPPAHYLRLVHPSLPWYIDIRASHPNGITIYDVLTQAFNQLATGIQSRHYYNETLSKDDRAAIAKAFGERARGNDELVRRGVVQVDYLGDKVLFEGLVRGWNGMWEMKTRSVGERRR